LQYPPDPKDEKTGRPKGHAGRFETRKARSKLDLIKPMGGAQGGADGPQAQEMRGPVPHVLLGNLNGNGPSRHLPERAMKGCCRTGDGRE